MQSVATAYVRYVVFFWGGGGRVERFINISTVVVMLGMTQSIENMADCSSLGCQYFMRTAKFSRRINKIQQTICLYKI